MPCTAVQMVSKQSPIFKVGILTQTSYFLVSGCACPVAGQDGGSAEVMVPHASCKGLWTWVSFPGDTCWRHASQECPPIAGAQGLCRAQKTSVLAAGDTRRHPEGAVRTRPSLLKRMSGPDTHPPPAVGCADGTFTASHYRILSCVMLPVWGTGILSRQMSAMAGGAFPSNLAPLGRCGCARPLGVL